jgi:phospholipid/cholesterol/gamma-HCH transport system substrate-binding protein
MASYQRNLLVGVTVLGALGIFMWMMLSFSSKTARLFAPPQTTIHFKGVRADGLSDGSDVSFLGVPVGHVMKVNRTPDGSGVIVDATVDSNPPLPANLKGRIAQSSALGTASNIMLDIDGDKGTGTLAADSTLPITYGGLQMNLIPPTLTAQLESVGKMASELGLLIDDLRKSNVVTNLNTVLNQINAQAVKVGDVLNSINGILNDPNLVKNAGNMMANLNDFSKATTQLSPKLDNIANGLQQDTDEAHATLQSANQAIADLQKRVDSLTVQLATTLQSVQSIAQKVDTGKGTAGQLVNDPKLYESLVDSVQLLHKNLADLDRLMQQWEQEGVSLKMK